MKDKIICNWVDIELFESINPNNLGKKFYCNFPHILTSSQISNLIWNCMVFHHLYINYICYYFMHIKPEIWGQIRKWSMNHKKNCLVNLTHSCWTTFANLLQLHGLRFEIEEETRNMVCQLHIFVISNGRYI